MSEPERITADRPMTDHRRYFHGGPRGLRVILPPVATGATSCASMMAAAARVCRRDKVYVTMDQLAALGFAAMVPNGTVYEVYPVNPVHDPDCSEPELSYEADKALIIRELRPRGSDLKKARKAMLA